MANSFEGILRGRSLKEVMTDATDAFAAMYDAHVDDVYRYVHRRCRDHALSEDITQETFMAAARKADGPDSITVGWLITVAKNRLIDSLRRQMRFEDRLHLLAVPHSRVELAELAERLRVEDALAELSVDYRLVLTLHYIDGYTVPALAEEMGRSVKSVEGIVTRARRALRTELERHEPTDDQSTAGSEITDANGVTARGVNHG